MGITHIVLFQFKESASPGEISEVSQRMLALKESCIHPTTQKPYIMSASGGTDNSSEGIQNGITHAFIVEFKTAEDRDYYVYKDPTHAEFKELAGQFLEKAQVIDFTDGVFMP
ncbi:stress responsive A/B barrel domain protein [Lindgomyces ingoldianus]|uniref:Stress responsive A/B barrel domain protein n=1 Tax=Lindgomyces ingoldianus TaxID=673940 RepID=A0ACB6QRE4_9PLEO|nr:stress responsive A/B barrel domain protein [Lindgomyces ingoldianus]KAF2468652.1 stress responsive A/B barrel domain protein [Lindgomyces ingoldianus]